LEVFLLNGLCSTLLFSITTIPGLEELMTRCSQEETRTMELEMPSNRNNPTVFSTCAKRKNDAGSKKQSQGRLGSKNGRKGRCFVCNNLVTMPGSVQIEGTHLMMMITIILGATTTIKGMAGSTTKGKGMLPLLNLEMIELLNSSKRNFILYLPSLLPLLQILWEIG